MSVPTSFLARMPEKIAPQNRVPLVFLHAFPLSSAMWDAQLEYFGQTRATIAPDFRGAGESALFGQKPSIAILARDVNALLDELQIERAIVAGCSMGGYVALEIARQFPKRLAALVLIDTRADADRDDAKKARAEMIELARANSGLEVAQKMIPKLLSETTRLEKPEIAEKVRAIASNLSGENAAKFIEALRDRADSTPILSSIAVPTLVLGGENDSIASPEIMGAMAAQIPNARHVILPRAGHLPNLETPGEFNLAIEEFLAEL